MVSIDPASHETSDDEPEPASCGSAPITYSAFTSITDRLAQSQSWIERINQSLDLADQVQRMTEPLLAMHDRLGRAFEPFLAESAFESTATRYATAFEQFQIAATPAFESLDRLAAFAERLGSSIEPFFAGIETLELNILREKGPDNWRDLHDTHDLRQLLGLAEAGIPVTWVPRASILAELLEADPEERLNVLLAHRDEILSDCATVSAPTRTGPFAQQATFLGEAITAFNHGLHAAAQALAASVMDTLLRRAVHEPVRRGYYNKVKDTVDSITFPELAWAVTHWPVLTALATFNGEDAVPPMFNRHATAHAVNDIQYTTTNALVAVMLATSVLREAHQVHTNSTTTIDDTA
jgi:hypothetical protein